jgi:hypothetical protein
MVKHKYQIPSNTYKAAAPNQQGRGHTANMGLIQRRCAQCESSSGTNAEDKEEIARMKPLAASITPFIQRKESGENTAGSELSSQINKSRGNGHSMDATTRSFMESRFDTDFSQVKIHTGSESVMMNRALNAKAFTVGNDIYFNEGQYNPGSNSGKHLLAHELTHTVQQQATKSIQRAPEPEAVKRKDIIIVGEGWDGSMQLAKVLKGAEIITVTSSDDLVAKLKAITEPVGTLYFITHATSAGSLKFGSAEGFVNPSDIAKKITGTFSADKAPQKLDFRGCNIGKDTSAMNELGLALGAASVLAGNCFAVIARTTPLQIGGKEITRASQVTKDNLELFKDLKTRTYNKLGDRKACVLNPSNKDYFAAGGVFVQLWFNPTFSGDWLPGQSVCYTQAGVKAAAPGDVIDATAGCQVIEVQTAAPPATAPATSPQPNTTPGTSESEE